MAENEVDAFPRTEISKPEPGEDAFRRDGELLAKRSDRLQEDIGICGQVSIQKRVSFLVEHASLHVSWVKVDATVVFMGYVVESHQALSFRGQVCTP